MFFHQILEREQEQSVVYGSIDFGKSVVTHPKYMDLLQRAGSQLKILPHTVINDKSEEIVLCSSVECKGKQFLQQVLFTKKQLYFSGFYLRI